MSREALSIVSGSGTGGAVQSAAGEVRYLLERPRLVLTMLDLMETFDRERADTGEEEVKDNAA